MGGIAGGLAMVIPAEIYGVVRHHSIWYVVNLLGRRRRGVVDPSHRRADEPFSSERVHHCQYHPGRNHSPRRHPLRRTASYLASKTDPARRHRCAHLIVVVRCNLPGRPGPDPPNATIERDGTQSFVKFC
jgi:hypothetical protein